jgi:3-oxoacyl-[acyl-carrier protein] reductase
VGELSARCPFARGALGVRRLPLGRWGSPDDAARLVGWLATDDAAWVTGQVLTSDGGFSLGG